MKKVLSLTIIMFLIFVSSSLAQSIDKAQIQSAKKDYLGLKPVAKPFSLIDFSRLTWSHSYSISFFSGGGTSGSIGLYTSSLFYEFSPSLSIDMTMNIAHNPGAFWGREVNSDAAFLPAANLDYHPSKHFRLSIGFATYPGIYYHPYSPYGVYNWRRLRQ